MEGYKNFTLTGLDKRGQFNLVYYYTENYKTNEKKEILQGIFNVILNKTERFLWN